jgi:Leucine-rich repeat (LRR) protein
MAYIEYQTFDKKIERISYGHNNQIDRIDLYGRSISKIIKISGLSGLKQLSLKSNKISKIEGLDCLTSLQELDMSFNAIEKIEGLEKLTSLQKLNLFSNRISKIENLNNLVDLQRLNIGHNICGGLERIEGLDNLRSLIQLNLSGNCISDIKGLENLHLLQELDLGFNRIDTIRGLDSLQNLQKLNLQYNHIFKIEGMKNQANLRQLILKNNRINRIEELEQLVGLQIIVFDNNRILRFEGLENQTNLLSISFSGCMIETIPLTILNNRKLEILETDKPINPIIRRMLERNYINSNRTTYNDPQNIHDSHINRSITDSLYRLMSEPMVLSERKIFEEIISDPILTNRVKEALIEWMKNPDVHSILNVTFMEAMRTIWQIIRKHPQSDSIRQIMNQEMQDSICYCFTGRLSRLTNCLNGFDPRVCIKISDRQEIANIIIAVKHRTDDLMLQKKLVDMEMTSRGYDKQTIGEWTAYLE